MYILSCVSALLSTPSSSPYRCLGGEEEEEEDEEEERSIAPPPPCVPRPLLLRRRPGSGVVLGLSSLSVPTSIQAARPKGGEDVWRERPLRVVEASDNLPRGRGRAAGLRSMSVLLSDDCRPRPIPGSGLLLGWLKLKLDKGDGPLRRERLRSRPWSALSILSAALCPLR
jgi:hypothetical protein